MFPEMPTVAAVWPCMHIEPLWHKQAKPGNECAHAHTYPDKCISRTPKLQSLLLVSSLQPCLYVFCHESHAAAIRGLMT